MSIWFQKSALIQARTSPVKFAASRDNRPRSPGRPPCSPPTAAGGPWTGAPPAASRPVKKHCFFFYCFCNDTQYFCAITELLTLREFLHVFTKKRGNLRFGPRSRRKMTTLLYDRREFTLEKHAMTRRKIVHINFCGHALHCLP